jgi:hypothetical protein
MTSDGRSRRMDAARVRAGLTVQDLWLRYLALGGTSDAFELDGYLQALVPLGTFQEDVLAQALNEALEDGYRSYRVPLSTMPVDDAGDDRLRGLVDGLLDAAQAVVRSRIVPPSAGPPEPGTAR